MHNNNNDVLQHERIREKEREKYLFGMQNSHAKDIENKIEIQSSMEK